MRQRSKVQLFMYNFLTFMAPIPLFWPHVTFMTAISLLYIPSHFYHSHFTFLTRLPSTSQIQLPSHFSDLTLSQLNHAYITFIPSIFLLSLSSHFYKSTPISLLRLSSHFYHYHLTLSIPSHFYDLSPPLPLLSLQSHFYELHLT